MRRGGVGKGGGGVSVPLIVFKVFNIKQSNIIHNNRNNISSYISVLLLWLSDVVQIKQKFIEYV